LESFLYRGIEDRVFEGNRTLLRIWVLLGTLIFTIVPGVLIPQAQAEAVNIAISRDSVTVQMNLVLQENLTTLPLVFARLDSTNSSAVVETFSQPINNSIQSLVPGARLSSLAIEVETSNVTNTWTLQENYTMTVKGANTNSGSNIRSNLAFIMMKLNDSLQLGGLEINNVGATLILPGLEAEASTYSNLKYYIDGANPSTAFIPEETTREFSLLDFTWVVPVDTWTATNSVLGQTTTWSLELAYSQYNLTLGVPSPEGPFLRTFVALYSPSISISAPANAWAVGNTVSFDVPTLAETLMPSIIVASLIIAIVGLVLDRRLRGPLPMRRKR